MRNQLSMGEVAYRAAYGPAFPWIWDKLTPIESARWERTAREVVKEYRRRESESRPWGWMDPCEEETCENTAADQQAHQVVGDLREIDLILEEAGEAPPSPRVGLPVELL